MKRCAKSGFTLIEMLTASTVFIIMGVLLFSVISNSTVVWRQSTANLDAFREARLGYEILTRNLSQATLNAYWDYDDPNFPTRYLRQSELHFLSGNDLAGRNGAVFFQMPRGHTIDRVSMGNLPDLLNSVGYYIAYVDEAQWRPAFVSGPSRERFWLMQYLQPAESMTVYQTADASWMTDVADLSQPVAQNVIALVVWPRMPFEEDPDGDFLTADYSYDSRANAFGNPQPVTGHQLPPLLQIAMVAIDESSAAQLEQQGVLETTIEGVLEGLFQASNYDRHFDDLDELERRLAEANIRYRVFETAVPLREAKWSES